MTAYSFALFNFIPELALDFFTAMRHKDKQTMDDLLLNFFYPFQEIRNQGAGYAVSIVKAGLKAIGREPGPVRPPLGDLKPNEIEALKAAIGTYK